MNEREEWKIKNRKEEKLYRACHQGQQRRPFVDAFFALHQSTQRRIFCWMKSIRSESC
jgi:hypothetical protein